MHNLTPDWSQVCEEIRAVLVDALEFLDMGLEDGADPMYVACDVLGELKEAFAAIEADPSGMEH